MVYEISKKSPETIGINCNIGAAIGLLDKWQSDTLLLFHLSVVFLEQIEFYSKSQCEVVASI